MHSSGSTALPSAGTNQWQRSLKPRPGTTRVPTLIMAGTPRGHHWSLLSEMIVSTHVLRRVVGHGLELTCMMKRPRVTDTRGKRQRNRVCQAGLLLDCSVPTLLECQHHLVPALLYVRAAMCTHMWIGMGTGMGVKKRLGMVQVCVQGCKEQNECTAVRICRSTLAW